MLLFPNPSNGVSQKYYNVNANQSFYLVQLVYIFMFLSNIFYPKTT